VGCIILTGTGAQLLNGAVQGGFHESIRLEGTGGHTVRNVTSTLVDANILVRSDHNQLINVMAESAISSAFFLAGHHNRLIDSIARCVEVVDNCIVVSGSQNRLSDNFVTSTTSAPPAPGRRGGFSITGENNVLRGNRAIGNEGPGITVSGTGNILSRNTALDNSIDLQDTNGDCTQNTWRQNTFRTSDPDCIGQSTRESVADMER
jgi:parallel beta-helix repeat protein